MSVVVFRGFGGRREAARLRGLAALLEAGVPLLSALDSLARGGWLAAHRLRQAALEGRPLSAAVSSDPLVRALAEAGEASGRLPEELRRAAQLLESRERVRRRVVAASGYPLLVLLALAVAWAVVVLVAVPAHRQAYAELGRDLPLPTRLLVWMARAAPWAGGLGVLGALVLAGTVEGRAVARRLWWRLLWRLPPVRLASAAHAWQVACGAWEAGLLLPRALVLAAQAAPHPYVAAAMRRLAAAAERGEPLHAAVLGESAWFGDEMAAAVAAGAESGRLGEVVAPLCAHLQAEAEREAEQLASLAEPLLLVVAGLLALVVALGLYLPLFSLR
jgi:MSHA biogenesis protein MshG